ncbi:MAG: RloB domain-containing protein, partial [Sphaerochaetaceae bacterium]
GMSITKKTFVNHIFDRESEEEHVQQFNKTLKRMKDSQKIGKTITYCLGYSNFAFELWMILHKSDCYKPFNYRHQYLKLLNEAYKEKFISLDEYKSEDNFKKLLKKLILTDVWIAIDRANNIMIRNKMNGYILHEYCGFKYYTVNPSLSVGNIFQNILEESRVPKS